MKDIPAIVNSEYVTCYMYADDQNIQIICKDSALVDGLVNNYFISVIIDWCELKILCLISDNTWSLEFK